MKPQSAHWSGTPLSPASAWAEPRDDFAETKDDRGFELRVGTRPWIAIGAPAVELGCVAESFTFHVVVTDFDHPFGLQRHERKVLAGVPAGEFVLTRCAFTGLVGCPIPPVAIAMDDHRLAW